MSVIIKLKESVNRIVNASALKSGISKIEKYKNKYSNERCFIIGNGPSLSVIDLEKLKNEYTFAANRIYKIYERTAWRPSFYCVQDYDVIMASYKSINNISESKKFVGITPTRHYPALKDCIAFKLVLDIKPYPELPGFSIDPAFGLYNSFTVTYACIQIACYMGFKKIYLIGVDHKYSVEKKADGTVVKHEGLKDHFDDNDKIDNIPQLDKSTLAYMAAKEYAYKHGIEIYNATRGGALEVFPRIDFDTLF